MAKKKATPTKKTATPAKKKATVTTTSAKQTRKQAPKTAAKQAKKPPAKKMTLLAPINPTPKNIADAFPLEADERNIHNPRVELLPPQLIEDTIESLRNLMDDFSEITRNNLTALQRRRKIGAGIRNYGFIDKASDLAEANPRFVQFFRIENLKNAIRNIENCREIVILLQSFARVVSNSMMVFSDEAYTMALIFYNLVREMSRRGDPEAMEIFNALRPFFRRTRHTSAEPTDKQIERDLHALIKGHADGKIVVENETPKITGGTRKVVDEVRRGRAAIKETLEEEEKN